MTSSNAKGWNKKGNNLENKQSGNEICAYYVILHYKIKILQKKF